MMKFLPVAALCCALSPLVANATSVVFEATPTDPGGAFNITAASGSSLVADSSPFVGSVFGGPGFAISGVESFSGTLTSGGLMTGLTFEIYQPTTSQLLEGCNAVCVDSMFNLSLFRGGVQQFSGSFFPDFDRAQRIEVAPGFVIFDTFVVTETSATNDNEFFANFEATLLDAQVPLPASGALMVAGLAASFAVARRKRVRRG